MMIRPGLISHGKMTPWDRRPPRPLPAYLLLAVGTVQVVSEHFGDVDSDGQNQRVVFSPKRKSHKYSSQGHHRGYKAPPPGGVPPLPSNNNSNGPRHFSDDAVSAPVVHLLNDDLGLRRVVGRHHDVAVHPPAELAISARPSAATHLKVSVWQFSFRLLKCISCLNPAFSSAISPGILRLKRVISQSAGGLGGNTYRGSSGSIRPRPPWCSPVLGRR